MTKNTILHGTYYHRPSEERTPQGLQASPFECHSLTKRRSNFMSCIQSPPQVTLPVTPLRQRNRLQLIIVGWCGVWSLNCKYDTSTGSRSRGEPFHQNRTIISFFYQGQHQMVGSYYAHAYCDAVGIVRMMCDRKTSPHTWCPPGDSRAKSDR